MPEPAARRLRPFVRIAALALVAGLGAGALAVYGIGGGADKAAACAASPRTLAAMKEAAVGEVAAAVVRDAPRAVPTLVFKDASGADLGLDRFRGKVVLLNLWATWCAPCRKEMPALDALQAQRGGDRFDVAAVSLDLGSPDKPKDFLKGIGVERLGFFHDPSNKTIRDLRTVGRGAGLPTTLILDSAGCEIAYLPGPAEWASPDALKLIDAALGG